MSNAQLFLHQMSFMLTIWPGSPDNPAFSGFYFFGTFFFFFFSSHLPHGEGSSGVCCCAGVCVCVSLSVFKNNVTNVNIEHTVLHYEFLSSSAKNLSVLCHAVTYRLLLSVCVCVCVCMCVCVVRVFFS